MYNSQKSQLNFIAYRTYFGMLLLVLNACSGGDGVDPTKPGERIPPEIINTTPADGSTGVPVSSGITVEFSETIDASTITTGSFTLVGASSVSGSTSVATDQLSATFTPNTDLPFSTEYTAIITTSVTDANRNALAENFVWQFTTENPPDISPPTVLSTFPTENATGVSIGATISVFFSEEIDSTTLDFNSLFLMGTGLVGGSVEIAADNLSATFTPDANLDFGTAYTATMTTAVTDLSGNSFDQNKVWSFTTEAAPDTSAPTVINTSPTESATNIALDTSITVVFSETVNPATVNSNSFILQGGSPITGTVVVAPDNLSATFTPNSDLDFDVVYTATITTAVTDFSDNPLSQNKVWQFTTVPDTIPPTVSSTTPVDGSSNIPVDTSITVVFSEPVAPASVTPNSFTLQGSAAVAGTVVVANDNLSATLTPSENLAYNTTYTATITTAITDTNGNPITQNFALQFTSAPDLLSPSLLSVTPLENATLQLVGSPITATFDEPIDCATVSTVSFQLNEDANNIPGTVICNNSAIKFNPTSVISNSALIANFTGQITDLAGNAASPYSWSFDIKPWTQLTGTDSREVSNSIAADDAGNIYIGGMTYGSLAATNAGLSDISLVKYDKYGNMAWARQRGSTGYDEIFDVTTDINSNIYVAGYTAADLEGQSAGSLDYIVAKYDPNGSMIWIKQMGSLGSEQARGITTDSSGNIYITGYTFSDLEGVNSGSSDFFIVKLDSSGNKLWGVQLGSTGNEDSYDIATDISGDVYVTGSTTGALGGNTNQGSTDLFIAKYDSVGSLVWVKQIGTVEGELGRDITVGTSGNIYVVGYTEGSIGAANAGFFDLLVIKLDSRGTVAWTRQLGTAANDLGYGITSDINGNIYATGSTGGDLDGNISAGLGDLFVVQYDNNGNKVWTKQLGTIGGESGSSVTTDGGGNIYITGATNGELDGSLNSGNHDFFVVKYNSDGRKL